MEDRDLVVAESPVGLLVAVTLAKGARRLEKSMGMVSAGEDDAIHQVRVSCRRLRSDLKLFRKLLAGAWAPELRADLAALAQACGEARDLEVIAALVRENATSEDNEEHVDTILTTLTLGLDRAAARSAEVVLGEATKDLLTTIESVAVAPDLTPKADRPCGEVLPELLQSATVKFAQEADKLKPWSPDDHWHEVRLLAKRVRYAADTSASVLGDEAKATAPKLPRTKSSWASTRTTARQQTLSPAWLRMPPLRTTRSSPSPSDGSQNATALPASLSASSSSACTTGPDSQHPKQQPYPRLRPERCGLLRQYDALGRGP